NRHIHVSPGETIARMAAGPRAAGVTLGPTLRARQSVPMTLRITAWCLGQLMDLVVEETKFTSLARARACFRRAMLRTRDLTENQRRTARAKERCPCGSGFNYGRCHGEGLDTRRGG